jgi:hypothetical protein
MRLVVLTPAHSFDTIPASFVNMRPAMTGSLAARTVETRQVREEAALRRKSWVPRITWLSLVSWTQITS